MVTGARFTLAMGQHNTKRLTLNREIPLDPLGKPFRYYSGMPL